jgi:hypothetical protein
MDESLEISNSRFSNWSQHLDLSIFRVFARQPAARKNEIDVDVAIDKIPWQNARENPVNWPRTRKAIHTFVPSMWISNYRVGLILTLPSDSILFMVTKTSFCLSDSF